MCFSRHLAGLLLAAALAGCSPAETPPRAAALATLPWDSVVSRAAGSRVVWRMWRGDPSINGFVDGWVAPELRERYGITLVAVDGQGPQIVNQLVIERETGARGSADLLWINGETFGQLRAEGLLGGPWAGSLPNARFIDSSSAIISRDFEQDPAGYESPWGTVQAALIYDTVRTPDPPRTVAALGEWILAHPGRFTHDQSFTGISFLKSLLYAFGGGVESFQGGFHEERYLQAREALFIWLDEHRDSFWRAGRTWPAGVAELHRLFANGEVDFTMSYNHNEVVAKVRQGVLPPTARALLLREGTIANTHYLGIPWNATNPAGAMVVADFLLSPEAQLRKQDPAIWGDGTVLAVDRLPEDWPLRFTELEGSPLALSRDSLRRYARPEVVPAYHERLLADWRVRFREQGR